MAYHVEGYWPGKQTKKGLIPFFEVLCHSKALSALNLKHNGQQSRLLEHPVRPVLAPLNDVHLIQCLVPLLLHFLCHQHDLRLHREIIFRILKRGFRDTCFSHLNKWCRHYRDNAPYDHTLYSLAIYNHTEDPILL